MAASRVWQPGASMSAVNLQVASLKSIPIFSPPHQNPRYKVRIAKRNKRKNRDAFLIGYVYRTEMFVFKMINKLLFTNEIRILLQ